jgi:hypothetical protein
VFRFTSYLNRTSMCRFRFGHMTPEPEPNRTLASLEHPGGLKCDFDLFYRGLASSDKKVRRG